jgi:plasmid stabilization system protein ParE
MSKNARAPCILEKVIFTPGATDDVAEAYAWYEEREPGLGEDFLRCVEACLMLVLRNPRLFPCALDDFRRALIRRFPFEIFYELTPEGLVVYSVFHCSQDPGKWRRRLGYDD